MHQIVSSSVAIQLDTDGSLRRDFHKAFRSNGRSPGPTSGPFVLGVSFGMFPPGWRGLDYESSTLPDLPPLNVTPPEFSIFRRKPQKSGIEVFLQIIHFATPVQRFPQYDSAHNQVWVENTAMNAHKPTDDPMHFAGILVICHGGDSLRDFNNVFPIRIKKSDIDPCSLLLSERLENLCRDLSRLTPFSSE